MNRKLRSRRLAAVGLAFMGAALLAPAAVAGPDDAALATVAQRERPCQLTRLGTQFVRCDNLCGNGVAAPSYVPVGAPITVIPG